MERAGAVRADQLIAEVFDDPQIKHRGMRIDPRTCLPGTCRWSASAEVRARRAAYARVPPLLGQHSDEALHELGFTDGEIAKLRYEGVV